MRYPRVAMPGDTITSGKVVRLKYTMKGEKGNVLDESGAEAEAYVAKAIAGAEAGPEVPKLSLLGFALASLIMSARDL